MVIGTIKLSIPKRVQAHQVHPSKVIANDNSITLNVTQNSIGRTSLSAWSWD